MLINYLKIIKMIMPIQPMPEGAKIIYYVDESSNFDLSINEVVESKTVCDECKSLFAK
jgi:hypothetical protein